MNWSDGTPRSTGTNKQASADKTAKLKGKP